MALLTDIETQLFSLLQPLVTDGVVEAVRPLVSTDELDPDDDEVSRVIEGLDSAVFVTLNGSDPDKQLGRTKVNETVEITLTAYIANKSAQKTTTRGDARRIGVYDLIDLVRALVENVKIAGHPGSRYRFAGHRRSGYKFGKLAWAITYEATIESKYDPEDSAEVYAEILGRVFLAEPPATNPAPIEFQRILDT